MTWRQLRVLIDGLPHDSALGRQLDPDQWTQDRQQRADAFDLAAVAGGVKTKGGQPVRAWRPSDREAAERQQANREARARAMKARRRGGAGG